MRRETQDLRLTRGIEQQNNASLARGVSLQLLQERSPTAHQPLRSSQPVPPRDPLDDGPLPNCPIRGIVVTERDKQLLADLRRASAMAIPRCIVSRSATSWAESLEEAISGHQSWAVLCRYHRNAELKLWLQLWEAGEIGELIGRILEQQHSGPLRRMKRIMQPQSDE